MNTTTRIAAAFGLLAVGLGAFGAHGLKPVLAANDTAAIWETAALYHLVHSVAALWASERRKMVAWTWMAGIVIFSGTLYLLAVSNLRWLGAITPVGGTLLIIGWAMIVFGKKSPTRA